MFICFSFVFCLFNGCNHHPRIRRIPLLIYETILIKLSNSSRVFCCRIIYVAIHTLYWKYIDTFVRLNNSTFLVYKNFASKKKEESGKSTLELTYRFKNVRNKLLMCKNFVDRMSKQSLVRRKFNKFSIIKLLFISTGKLFFVKFSTFDGSLELLRKLQSQNCPIFYAIKKLTKIAFHLSGKLKIYANALIHYLNRRMLKLTSL